MDTMSPSQLDSLSGCRLSWQLLYKQGWRSRRSSLALELGTALHYALEMYYSKKGSLVKSFEDWIDKRVREMSEEFPDSATELYDQRALGISMLEGYLTEYEGKEDFTILATEKYATRPLLAPKGQFKLNPGCDISVRLDGLVKDNQTGRLFVLEHKSYSQFSPQTFDMDIQISAQTYVAETLVKEMNLEGEMSGVIWNGLRKMLPGPRVKNKLFERHRL